MRAGAAQALGPGIDGYEVVVVDDGSRDGTAAHLKAHAAAYPHVRLLEHGRNRGAAAARNTGVAAAAGEVIVFIDSDLVVGPAFLRAHAAGLAEARARDGDDRTFTYGRVVHTNDFADPAAARFKASDASAAFFATGNVAIAKARLLGAAGAAPADGPFDAAFSAYGWEDLELGERLRQRGAKLKRVPEAVGWHWHPEFSVERIPALVRQEEERGANGARFLRKHPNLRVRLMVQLTPLHLLFWGLLTLGGLLDARRLTPLLAWLCRRGHPRAAFFLLTPYLNWVSMRAAARAYARPPSPERRARGVEGSAAAAAG